MKKTLLLLTVLATAGCGGLKDGTYLLAVTSVNENTCPLDDDDLVEVGNHNVLVWKDSILIGGRTYVRTGDLFVAADTSVNDELDPCFVKVDRLYSGLILSNESFTIDYAGDVYVEGDCSDVNTDGLPCSIDLTLDAVRVF